MKYFTTIEKYFRKVNFIFFLIFLSLSFQNFSQIDNSSFYFEKRLDTLNIPKWKIEFKSLSFMQNREYFGEIADGYTLFGNQISPKIVYQPNKKFFLVTGAYLRKDFGNPKFTEIQPIFTVIIQKDSTQFRFGNLDGNLSHRLIEPLYNFEGIINNNLESGVQLTKQNKGNYFDCWIDWQRMIYQKSTFKEEIWGGINWKPIVYQKKNTKITFPVQFTAYHIGGQITSDKSPLKTEVNIALGNEIVFNKMNKKIIFQNYFLGFKEQSNVAKALKSGTGFYSNLTIQNSKLNVMLSYYFANSFSSNKGGDLFQSINKNNPTSTEKYRNLLIIRLYKDFEIIKNVYLIARFEPYYDLNNNRFEHSEGLFLSYKETFGLSHK
jgi:hypothetical protein